MNISWLFPERGPHPAFIFWTIAQLNTAVSRIGVHTRPNIIWGFVDIYNQTVDPIPIKKRLAIRFHTFRNKNTCCGVVSSIITLKHS